MIDIKQYRKKPVVISAIQFDGENQIAIMDFVGKGRLEIGRPPLRYEHDHIIQDEQVWIKIPTLEGIMTADRFDYIIKGVRGECYPCKPDIFLETYEIVNP